MTVDLATSQPRVYRRMVAFDAAAHEACTEAGLDPKLVELVKIRISQLNGCAYCLRMHTREALAQGESTDRLAVLPAWWESQYFSDVERAALALAQDVTSLPAPYASEQTGLTDEQVGALTWLSVVMNAWNRVAVCSHYPVGPQD